MGFRALTDVCVGNAPPLPAGELIPETFLNMTGQQVPVDFDRLVELGAAEEVAEDKPKPARKPRAPRKAKATA